MRKIILTSLAPVAMTAALAAPALAASMAESAICLGLRGTCGERSCVPPEPVTAHVMKTSRFMDSGMGFSRFRLMPSDDVRLGEPISIVLSCRQII